MGGIDRRQFLGTIGASAGVLVVPSCSEEPPQVEFLHGVASGDPKQDRIILWTRATPISPEIEAGFDLTYEISGDPGFENMVSSGTVSTGPECDYTVKVDATGLRPGKRYFYRFRHGSAISPAGRTRTLPEGIIGSARLAVVSCSSFPHGFFNVYREIAARLDIDVVLHLGDYIYEYDAEHYFSEEARAKGRLIEPTSELTTLDRYRTRHALYKSDPDLRAAHAAHPFIVVWDDHEIANNTYRDGAKNHNEGEGDWKTRRAAAMQAYHEWLPIRESGEGQDHIYRSFEIGDLASLIMLDTRHVGRSRQLTVEDMVYHSIYFDFTDKDNPVAVTSAARRKGIAAENLKLIPVPFNIKADPPQPMLDYAEIKALDPKKLPKGFSYLPDGQRLLDEKVNAKGRTLLGDEQEEWLRQELATSRESGRPWQIIGQQIICGVLYMPDIADKIDDERPAVLSKALLGLIAALHPFKVPLVMDEWGGYGQARARFVHDLGEHAENAVVLSGDSHDSWAFDLTDQEAGKSVAVEFAGPSVTSPGLGTIFPVDPIDLGIALQEKNPDLKYVRMLRSGYMIVEITAEYVTTTWNLIDTVLDRSYSVHIAKTMRVGAGAHRLEDF